MDARTWHRLTAPLRRRIASLLLRGVVRLSDSAPMMQTVQAVSLDGLTLDNVEHWEPYGYTSRPHAGAEALLAAIEGKRGHTVAVNIADRRYRLTGLAAGEVALYDDLGNAIHFRRDRIHVAAVQHLEVAAPTTEITSTTTHIGDVTINGNLTVSGNIAADGEITDLAASGGTTMSHVRQVYDGHDHDETGTVTNPPNQVM